MLTCARTRMFRFVPIFFFMCLGVLPLLLLLFLHFIVMLYQCYNIVEQHATADCIGRLRVREKGE